MPRLSEFCRKILDLSFFRFFSSPSKVTDDPFLDSSNSFSLELPNCLSNFGITCFDVSEDSNDHKSVDCKSVLNPFHINGVIQAKRRWDKKEDSCLGHWFEGCSVVFSLS